MRLALILQARYAEIAPSTGNLGDLNMKNMLQTPSIVENDYAISYGFYDAGIGENHQAYMYVTDNYSNWMGDLMNVELELKNKPFGTFVLPGSHDAGMFAGIDSDDAAREFVNGLVRKYSMPYELSLHHRFFCSRLSWHMYFLIWLVTQAKVRSDAF